MTDRQREQTRQVVADPAAVAAQAAEQDKQRAAAREALAHPPTAEVEGGRYKVGDRFVDANGDEIKAKAKD